MSCFCTGLVFVFQMFGCGGWLWQGDHRNYTRGLDMGQRPQTASPSGTGQLRGQSDNLAPSHQNVTLHLCRNRIILRNYEIVWIIKFFLPLYILFIPFSLSLSPTQLTGPLLHSPNTHQAPQNPVTGVCSHSQHLPPPLPLYT